jgi:hypothetical protein
MQHITLTKKLRLFLKLYGAVIIVFIASLFLFSFTIKKMADGFLQQLGMSKTEADKKITNSILGGYLDAYGVKNIKNIAAGNKTAIAKDLLAYTRKQVNSAAFIKEYAEMRKNHMPQPDNIETPEETRKRMVAEYKKGLASMETMLATADAATKKSFEKLVADTKKQLAEAEDLNSKSNQQLKKSYEDQLKYGKAAYEKRMAEWEAQYPASQQLFIKKRLEQFLTETENIDFNAALVPKNNKMVFANAAYESKGKRWKMAYRAGKEVVETARTFVEQWLNELK